MEKEGALCVFFLWRDTPNRNNFFGSACASAGVQLTLNLKQQLQQQQQQPVLLCTKFNAEQGVAHSDRVNKRGG